MADNEMIVKIAAKTDEFIKNVESAKTKVRSLAMQMAEIDKQLKTESVDRVQKLGEKLELAKRAAAAASAEAEQYGISVKKLTDKHEDLNKLTDKQKESLLKYIEQMATAQQKANTYTAEVDKLQKEYDEATKAAQNNEAATENLADSLGNAATETENLSEETEKGKDNTKRFFDQLKEGVAINLVTDGLKKIGSFFANIAAKALEAAKAIVSFAKDYAKEAIDMAADYEDALGYSEQVFENHAETVQEWVKDNSVSLRLNISELQTYVNNMGSLYRSFGFEGEKAAEMSEKLIERAADLKAATGQELTAVIESLTSVMTGGYKAGYKYGIVINEASINAYALSNNIAKVAVNEEKVKEASLKVEKATKKVSEITLKYGENSLETRDAQLALEKAETALEEALGGQVVALTQAQKEEAIYRMILDQTSHVADQRIRESSGYKSQLDALKTTFDNLKISIGDKLLPVVTDLITKFNEFIASDEGQQLLDSIVESIGELSNKIMEMLNDGRFEEWMASIKEKIPEIVEDISNFTDKIIELIPQIFDLTEKLLSLFGIETEAEKAKRTYNEIKDSIEELAESYSVSTDTMQTAIAMFAEENHIKVSDVYSDWNTYKPKIEAYLIGINANYNTELIGGAYSVISDFAAKNNVSLKTIYENWDSWEPKIKEYAESLGSDYDEKLTESLSYIETFAEQNGLTLQQVLSKWEEYEPQINTWMNTTVSDTETMTNAVAENLASMPETAQENINKFNNLEYSPLENFIFKVKEKLNWLKNSLSEFELIDDSGNTRKYYGGGGWLGSRSSGGAVKAGQLYRVNDDNGRRIEVYRPNFDGEILNGNETRQIVNNSTNNSRTYGDVIVNVNSYGTDAASIADEIGAAVNRKLRMAGSW